MTKFSPIVARKFFLPCESQESEVPIFPRSLFMVSSKVEKPINNFFLILVAFKVIYGGDDFDNELTYNTLPCKIRPGEGRGGNGR